MTFSALFVIILGNRKDAAVTYERCDNMSLFSNTINLGEIFEKYNCGQEAYVNMQIGFDRRLYSL